MLFELRSLKEDSGNTKFSLYKSNKTIFLGGVSKTPDRGLSFFLRNGCFRVRVRVSVISNPNPNPKKEIDPDHEPGPGPDPDPAFY